MGVRSSLIDAYATASSDVNSTRVMGARKFREAASDSEILELDGVGIPIAGIDTLIRTKLTVRPDDAADRQYLERLRADSDAEFESLSLSSP